mgnify:CR=1 FL=1
MKAVVHHRYGGPELLRVLNIKAPEPKKGQVRVKVSACAVNLSDWEYLVGSPIFTRLVGGLFRPKTPVLGSDIVGVIDKLGADVSGLEVGQRVMGDYVMTRGGFAECASDVDCAGGGRGQDSGRRQRATGTPFLDAAAQSARESPRDLPPWSARIRGARGSDGNTKQQNRHRYS